MKRALTLFFAIFLFLCSASAQQKHDSIKTALLIIDIQEFYFPGENSPGLVNAEQASIAAKELLQIFREKKELVVHVRHKSKKGFEIHKNVAPLPTEKVVTKEEVNAFYRTDLQEYLRSNGISRLVIIGMQTQMCLEAGVRAAHDLGFECIVVPDACATRDVKFGGKTVKAEDVQTAVLATFADGGYAKVVGLEDFRGNPDKYLFEKIEKN